MYKTCIECTIQVRFVPRQREKIKVLSIVVLRPLHTIVSLLSSHVVALSHCLNNGTLVSYQVMWARRVPSVRTLAPSYPQARAHLTYFHMVSALLFPTQAPPNLLRHSRTIIDCTTTSYRGPPSHHFYSLCALLSLLTTRANSQQQQSVCRNSPAPTPTAPTRS
jgi:hypothetical protein